MAPFSKPTDGYESALHALMGITASDIESELLADKQNPTTEASLLRAMIFFSLRETSNRYRIAETDARLLSLLIEGRDP